MITVKERRDILSAYREVGSYRDAADICGTTPKTVKRAVLADAENDATAVEVVAHNYDEVRDVVAERVAKTHGRITAKRLLPVATAAGYDGSDRNFRRLVAEEKRSSRRSNHRGRRAGGPPRTTCGWRPTTRSGPTSARATTPSPRASSRTSSAT